MPGKNGPEDREKRRRRTARGIPGAPQNAPIARLPNEILINIFIEANSDPFSPGKNDPTRNFNVEVVISHVCSQWRAVSLGVHTFWSNIYFAAHLSNSRAFLPRLYAYLERSASVLLNIWIDFRGRAKAPRGGALMSALLPHIRRWRSFTFFPRDGFHGLTFFKQLEHLEAPNMETFCILGVTGNDPRIMHFRDNIQLWRAPNSAVIFKNGAPKLSLFQMDIHGFYLYLPPISNLSTLYVLNVEDKRALIVNSDYTFYPEPLFIHSIANLTNLTLDNICLARGDDVASTIVSPKLRNLRICKQTFGLDVLPHWKLPVLQTLTFHQVRFEIELLYNNLVDAPNLHSLFLVDCNISYNNLLLVRMAESVKKIVFSDSRSRSAGVRPMELLDYNYSQQGWPLLQDITINLRNPGKFDIEFFLKTFPMRPQVHSLTLRVDSSVLAGWGAQYAPRLALLEELCTIETLDDSIPYIPSPWPVTTHDGAFRTLYEKLELPLIKRYSLTS